MNPIPPHSLLGQILAQVAERPQSARAIAKAIGTTRKKVNPVLYAAHAFYLKSGWSPLCVRGVSEDDDAIKLWGTPPPAEAADDEVAAAAEVAEAEAAEAEAEAAE